MQEIIEYINEKYAPVSVIVYGSYANGTNNKSSDFDALVISHHGEQIHDTSFVSGIQLDVFVYPATYFDDDYDCNDFIQIFDGQIIIDTDERGKALQNKVFEHIKNRPLKTSEEIRCEIDWCTKMLERAKRYDAEGMFRWHWVLTDSLEIFCDIKQHTYFGPKKTLKWMKESHSTAFACYENALKNFSIESLECWINYLKDIV